MSAPGPQKTPVFLCDRLYYHALMVATYAATVLFLLLAVVAKEFFHDPYSFPFKLFITFFALSIALEVTLAASARQCRLAIGKIQCDHPTGDHHAQ